MPRIAIIGGIGSGKTAVTDHLAQRGAVIVDADVVARDVVAPGQPALGQLVDAFGAAVLDDSGRLDRGFVAAVVFHDPSALRRLNHITHGAIGVELVRLVDQCAGDDLVAVALPLYRPVHRDVLGLDEVWCVCVDPDVALARLTGSRGLTREDATARVAAQATNEERRALADVAIENDQDLESLYARIDHLLDERGWLRG